MSVLDRSALEASPLADLHAIATELSIDGYRRLRKADLIAAILKSQGEEDAPGSTSDGDDERADAAKPAETKRPAAKPARSRTARAKPVADEVSAQPAAEATIKSAAEVAAEPEASDEAAGATPSEGDEDAESGSGRRRRGRRGGRSRTATREEAGRSESDEPVSTEEESETASEDEIVEGVVELLANGSGFVRVDPPDPSDEDVYISSAQVKRCELVSGDRVAGPKRAPRRSERFASLIRVETINGRPASELADSVHFDDLPAAFPSERIPVGSEDPTLKAIEWLTPFGRGSRVTIAGDARSGKSVALRGLALALAEHEELTVTVVIAGVRPEEISEWNDGPFSPVGAVSFAASEDARNAVIDPAIDQARRLAARGAHAVLLIDTLDGASPPVARRALASARNISGGGSLTVIATARAPIGGETTVVALNAVEAGRGRFPALDLTRSGTMRAELLVGEAGAEAIASARAQAAEGEAAGGTA
jgi:transcription termination factor Rho